MPFKPLTVFFAALLSFFASGKAVNAHPHVFVRANMEIVLDDKNRFHKLRHVWEFDELFSATILLDFDADGSNDLGKKELKEITTTVKQSIAEYDFYTALRGGSKNIEFYEPEEIFAYLKDGKLIMFFEVETSKPYAFDEGPLRVSASDDSFYVAFEFDENSIKIADNKKQCATSVTVPDFDELYAANADTLTESFFNQPDKKPGLGDEFFTWATIQC